MSLMQENQNKPQHWWQNLSPITERLVILSLIVAVLAIGTVLVVQNAANSRIVENMNNKTLYELVGYNRNVETLLSKATITSTPSQSSHILADIWRQADLAKQNLESLPLSQETTSDVAGYLAQTSDFAYSVMRQTVQGKKISDEQYENLKQLHDYSVKIDKILMDIYDQSNQGNLDWAKLQKTAEQEMGEAVPTSTGGLQDLTKTMQDYEGLIYDGAFSNHIESLKPKFLSDNIVDVETAKQNMIKYLDETRIEKVEYSGESEGNIPAYSFKVKYKDQDDWVNIDMSKQDGVMLWMVYNRDVNERKLDVDQCKKIAKDYLTKLGFENMADTYYSLQGNMITINLAYMQGNTICYPDLIKVKIAMDNGEVCSIETHGYVYNHTNRTITDEVSISMDAAKKVLNKDIEVKSSKLAVIPTDWQGEVVVYEFQGFVDDRNFLIYINAKTGVEEKIFVVIDNQNGILTM